MVEAQNWFHDLGQPCVSIPDLGFRLALPLFGLGPERKPEVMFLIGCPKLKSRINPQSDCAPFSCQEPKNRPNASSICKQNEVIWIFELPTFRGPHFPGKEQSLKALYIVK